MSSALSYDWYQDMSRSVHEEKIPPSNPSMAIDASSAGSGNRRMNSGTTSRSASTAPTIVASDRSAGCMGER